MDGWIERQFRFLIKRKTKLKNKPFPPFLLKTKKLITDRFLVFRFVRKTERRKTACCVVCAFYPGKRLINVPCSRELWSILFSLAEKTQ